MRMRAWAGRPGSPGTTPGVGWEVLLGCLRFPQRCTSTSFWTMSSTPQHDLPSMSPSSYCLALVPALCRPCQTSWAPNLLGAIEFFSWPAQSL